MKKIFFSLLSIPFLIFAENSYIENDTPSHIDSEYTEKQTFSTVVSLLYWKPKGYRFEDGLKQLYSTDEFTFIAERKLNNILSQSKVGFRIAIGCLKTFNELGLWVQQTRFSLRKENSDSISFEPQKKMQSICLNQGAEHLGYAISKTHLKLDVTDLFLERIMNSHSNLKTSILYGGTITKITHCSFLRIYNKDALFMKMSEQKKFFGSGLRLANNFNWSWRLGIDITGGFSIAVLLGSYETNAQGVLKVLSSPSRDLNSYPTRSLLTAQAFFGSTFKKNFYGNNTKVFIGHEINTWLDLSKLYKLSSCHLVTFKKSLINSIFLTLQGLNAHVSLDF